MPAHRAEKAANPAGRNNEQAKPATGTIRNNPFEVGPGGRQDTRQPGPPLPPPPPPPSRVQPTRKQEKDLCPASNAAATGDTNRVQNAAAPSRRQAASTKTAPTSAKPEHGNKTTRQLSESSRTSSLSSSSRTGGGGGGGLQQAAPTGSRPRAEPSQQQQQRQATIDSKVPAEAAYSSKPSNKEAKQMQQQQESFQQAQIDDLNEGIVIGTADDEELIGDNSTPSRGISSLPADLTAGLTRNLMWAVFASAVGSSFQHGYNGGVVNAPESLIGQFVNATYTKRHGQAASETQVDFIVAIIVSIFCIGGCFGALLTAFVADRIGRKEGLMYNNIMVLIAAPMMASAKAMSSYELLILGRFLIGINAGLNAGLAPLYLNEIAPVKLRGALGTIYQLVITISILLSNIFGLPSLLGDETSWPILFAIPIVPAAFMLAALPHCCESPKHLILNLGSELQAQQALAWLRQTGDVQEEMDELRGERELQTMNQRSIVLGDMWYDRSLRKPMTIAIVIMLSQQLSGINAVLFFSTSIFRDAGLGAQAAINATLGMGLVNVVMTLVSLFLVDRAGRRTLHMTGLMGMAATSLVLALCLSDNTVDKAPLTSGLAVVAVYVYIGMFASGPGAIPWFLVAELFPSNARPMASSIAVAVNWLANFTVSLCFLPLSNVLHGFTFIMFAILLVIFYLFTYYKVPETKGATADEISALFKR